MPNHGTSQYMTGGLTLVAEADYYDFAPASCCCLSFLNSSFQQGRTYLRVWDNRMEKNFPVAPFGCFTTSELCVVDQVQTTYYDRPPFRSGMCCWICPVTCCGPPVIFVKKPMCFCCDLSPYFGQQLMSAPCNYYNLKTCCCCGEPCYVDSALPISMGLKDGDALMAKFQASVDSYRIKHALPEKEMAIFRVVTDNVDIGGISFGGANKVHAADKP